MKINFNSNIYFNFKNSGSFYKVQKQSTINLNSNFKEYDKAISAINQGIAFLGISSVTRENKNAIIEMYKNGKSTKEIAEIFGCAHVTIYNALRRWGELREKFNSEGNRNYIISLYSKGQSATKIAKILNCSERTVYKILSKSGMISKKFKPERDAQKVRKMVAEGKSAQEISYELNCKPEAIYYTMRRYNIEYKCFIDRNKDKILELYKEGYTIQKIADTLACSTTAVRKALVRWIGTSRPNR